MRNGTLSQVKNYYAPSEPIILEVLPDQNCKFESLSANFNGTAVNFTHIEGNKYQANFQHADLNYTDDSILYIDAKFSYVQPFNYIALICTVSAIVAIALAVFLLRKIFVTINKGLISAGYDYIRVKRLARKRLWATVLGIILSTIFVGGIVCWILFLLDVLFIAKVQVLLIILFPIISAVSLVGLRFVQISYYNKKHRLLSFIE